MAGTSEYLRRPLTKVRRQDRVLSDEEWLDRFLETAAVGHVAVCWEGEPLLHSNLFWFDGQKVFWHTAHVGKFRAVLDTGVARACFTVTDHGRILPADTPLNFSTEYASVVLYGPVRVVGDSIEKRYALEGMMTKYAPQLEPGRDYIPMSDDDVERTSVYCLEIETRVGKHNVKPVDYPAYPYPGGSFLDLERLAERYTLRPKDLA
ncbi:MAG: pyridoxamine 5'-phosphate oxidase family protein [Chloroflexi bacterium]|nr:pyridoxamine 5'-phosphate oxidase family protein [Chloroflexota bacterium]